MLHGSLAITPSLIEEDGVREEEEQEGEYDILRERLALTGLEGRFGVDSVSNHLKGEGEVTGGEEVEEEIGGERVEVDNRVGEGGRGT